jgi:GH15 family glucan-1,4-alpha-glucosidase
MPLLRFMSPSDPRWISTLAVFERDLMVDTTVSRYCSKEGIDGLQGNERLYSLLILAGGSSCPISTS